MRPGQLPPLLLALRLGLRDHRVHFAAHASHLLALFPGQIRLQDARLVTRLHARVHRSPLESLGAVLVQCQRRVHLLRHRATIFESLFHHYNLLHHSYHVYTYSGDFLLQFIDHLLCVASEQVTTRYDEC